MSEEKLSSDSIPYSYDKPAPKLDISTNFEFVDETKVDNTHRIDCPKCQKDISLVKLHTHVTITDVLSQLYGLTICICNSCATQYLPNYDFQQYKHSRNIMDILPKGTEFIK